MSTCQNAFFKILLSDSGECLSLFVGQDTECLLFVEYIEAIVPLKCKIVRASLILAGYVYVRAEHFSYLHSFASSNL